MSYLRIWIHCVWTTKRRKPFLRDEIRSEVIQHIYNGAKQKGIIIECINGYTEHLHALISLRGCQTVSWLMQQIKGESSFWINKNKLTKSRFEWQDDYYAVSIGISHIETLRKYIRNQEQHHNKTSVKEELDTLINKYKMVKVKD